MSEVVKDLRRFTAAGTMVALMIALVLFLTYVPVPAENKDIIIGIVGMLVGGGSMALPTLLSDDDEKKKLMGLIREAELKVLGVNSRLDRLGAKYDILKENYDELVDRLVDRHVISGNGINEDGR